jgi:hypothetical protein
MKDWWMKKKLASIQEMTNELAVKRNDKLSAHLNNAMAEISYNNDRAIKERWWHNGSLLLCC